MLGGKIMANKNEYTYGNLNFIDGKWYFKGDKVDDYNNDIEKNKRMKKNNKDKYMYNLKLLPQPYFGNIMNPDIIILALNPSYAPGDDEIDTYLFKTRIKDDYLKSLQNVDFTKKIDYDELNNFLNNTNEAPDINYCFINTWKWWQNNVFRNIVFQEKEIGIINLCSYHSKQYRPFKELFKSQYNFKNYLKPKLEEFKSDDSKLLIIVWGKSEWNNYLTDTEESDFFKDFKNIIVLNDAEITNAQNKSLEVYCNKLSDKGKKYQDFFIVKNEE